MSFKSLTCFLLLFTYFVRSSNSTFAQDQTDLLAILEAGDTAFEKFMPYQKIINAYEELLKQSNLTPDQRFKIYFGKCKVYLNTEHIEKAIVAIDKSLEIKPENLEALRLKSVCIAEKNRDEKSLLEFTSKYPADLESRLFLAECQIRFNKNVESSKTLELIDTKKLPENLLGRYHYAKSLVHIRDNEFVKGLEHLQKAEGKIIDLRKSSSIAEVYYTKSMTLFALGKWKESEQYSELAVANLSSYAKPWQHLWLCSIIEGRHYNSLSIANKMQIFDIEKKQFLLPQIFSSVLVGDLDGALADINSVDLSEENTNVCYFYKYILEAQKSKKYDSSFVKSDRVKQNKIIYLDLIASIHCASWNDIESASEMLNKNEDSKSMVIYYFAYACYLYYTSKQDETRKMIVEIQNDEKIDKFAKQIAKLIHENLDNKKPLIDSKIYVLLYLHEFTHTYYSRK
jgi:tetratricopeptide (TPR) repeat protein